MMVMEFYHIILNYSSSLECHKGETWYIDTMSVTEVVSIFVDMVNL